MKKTIVKIKIVRDKMAKSSHDTVIYIKWNIFFHRKRGSKDIPLNLISLLLFVVIFFLSLPHTSIMWLFKLTFFPFDNLHNNISQQIIRLLASDSVLWHCSVLYDCDNKKKMNVQLDFVSCQFPFNHLPQQQDFSTSNGISFQLKIQTHTNNPVQ